MTTHEIHIGDTVMSRNHPGVYEVIQTRNTVGIMRPEDEMLLQDVKDAGVTHWDTRGSLSKLKKREEV
jgi:hypothetical protein